MICKPCSEYNHENCLGIKKHKTHCDCQHKPVIKDKENGQGKAESGSSEAASTR